MFGRGGEEAEALAAAGIPFEVVPGVTTPLGIAAYTGVPLTHREHTSAVTFVTGHAVDAIDWDKVGQAETLVIFMGLTTFRGNRARADRARPRAGNAGHGGALGHPPGPGDRSTGTLATLPGADRRARHETARHHRGRRSGAAAREAELVSSACRCSASASW